MIDEHWFASINCLTGTKITGDSAGRLRAKLGGEDEVLAHLLLRTRAFSDWPNARQAFRKAVRLVIRPQPVLRSAVLRSAVLRQAGTGTESPALRSAFAAATIARMQGDDHQEPIAQSLALPSAERAEAPSAETLRQLRLAGSGLADDPHIFIAPALRDQ